MLTALIVIYNKNCCESESFKFIEKYKNNISIILFDNSIQDFGNKEYCRKNDIIYYNLGENIGLSKAYNYVLNKIKISSNNYLLVLDDDTILNDNYLNEIFKIVKDSRYDILLPIVKSCDTVISPSIIFFDCMVKKVKNIEKINMKKISAINSGMVIKTSVYKTIKYNEKLFLDYVDHEFMCNIRKNNKKIIVLDSPINQNYSRNQINSINSELIRFNIFKKDFKEFCRINNRGFFYFIYITRYTIKESIKYKSLKFFINRGDE